MVDFNVDIDERIVSRITLFDYRFINPEEGHRYVRNVDNIKIGVLLLFLNTAKNTIFGSNLAISCKTNNLYLLIVNKDTNVIQMLKMSI